MRQTILARHPSFKTVIDRLWVSIVICLASLAFAIGAITLSARSASDQVARDTALRGKLERAALALSDPAAGDPLADVANLASALSERGIAAPALAALAENGNRAAALAEVSTLAADLSERVVAGQSAFTSTQRRALQIAMVMLALTALGVLAPTYVISGRQIRGLHSRLRQAHGSIARLRHENAALQTTALHDAATGLPNAPGFRAALDRWLAIDGDPVCVHVLDLAPLGPADPALSEEVLCAVAAMLADRFDESVVVGRLTETEFALLSRRAPDEVAESVQTLLEPPLSLGDRVLRVPLKIGYAVHRSTKTTDLMVAARSALQRAKSSLFDTVIGYSEEIRIAEERAVRMSSDLPRAIIDGQFKAEFQPQICLRTGTLTGVEALARWEHPSLGKLSPGDFLSVAHRQGLARDVDHEVWSHALRQMTIWRGKDLKIPHLALNASPQTIADPRLLTHILAQLAGLGLEASDIVIEVPDKVFGTDTPIDAAMNVERLMAAGIRVELDGLGPTSSSVMNLPERGLSGVKLDHALSQMDQSPGAARSVRAMMALLEELKIPASAKGIETDRQSRKMADAGCVRVQGNLISAPMNAAEFFRWIAANRGDTAESIPAE